LDSSKWSFEVNCDPSNHELQCYTDRSDNARVENGNLLLIAKPENYQNHQFTSARIHSQCSDGGSFMHGRFEMRAKMPKGKQLWPAFWMLSSDEQYGGWPKSGEIDILEYRGQETSNVNSAIHYGQVDTFKSSGAHTIQGMDFSKDFHVFSMEWTSTNMKFFVDGKQYWQASTNDNFGSFYNGNGKPFDQRFYILLNVAIGGNFFSGPAVTPAEAKKWENPVMMVDYVRAYQDSNEQNTPPVTGLPKNCGQSKQVIIYAVVGAVGGALIIVGIIIGVVWWKRRKGKRVSLVPLTETKK